MPKSLIDNNSASDFLRAPPGDRYEEGRSVRASVPLEAHAEIVTDSERSHPLPILAEQDKSRLPELIPIRYGRMSVSPFTYLRGAAAVMASDLAAGAHTDLRVELCGDAHLGNFRWYRAPSRDLVFDINDFDETLPGPFEWDVKRLAASITVSARNNGFSAKQCSAATRWAMQNYRESIRRSSELRPFDLYYYRFGSKHAIERVKPHGKKHLKWKKKVLNKAGRKNSMRALKKLTKIVDGRRVITPNPPVIVRVDEKLEADEYNETLAFFELYRETLPLDRRLLIDRFTPVDVARKIVGVGSVGTRCLILLLQAGDGTPLFLQFKQAVPSVLEPYLGASTFDQAGQRVVQGQQLIQATSDVMLGWARWHGNPEGTPVDFYFRQLWDGKGKYDVDNLSPKRFRGFAGMCGNSLALSHARSGDAMMIRGYIGSDETFDDVMVEFAERYADITESDHWQLSTSIEEGAIEAIHDI